MYQRSTKARVLSLGLLLASPAPQGGAPKPVAPAALRAHASEYPEPAYPNDSSQAKHTGRVVVDVVVGANTATSPLARVQSSRMVQAPDSQLAAAVMAVLHDARWMPFFDGATAVPVSSRVEWDFRITGGEREVIDPYAPARRATETPAQLAADDLRIVRRATEILSKPEQWNRADTRQCPPTATTVSLYCALELATLDVTGAFDHRGNVMEDARQALDVVSPHHPDYRHWLMDYNNDPSTAFADIRQVLHVAEERIAGRQGTTAHH